MNNELKPCPFCGGEARIVYMRTRKAITPFGNESIIPKGQGYWTVGCETYDCILFFSRISNQPRLLFCDGSKKIVIERWNRRVVDADSN